LRGGLPVPDVPAGCFPVFNFEQTVSAQCERVAGSHRLASDPLAGPDRHPQRGGQPQCG